MARASTDKVNADAELPPLGPFSAEAELAGAWSSALVLMLLLIGLSLAALVAIAAGFGGGA